MRAFGYVLAETLRLFAFDPFGMFAVVVARVFDGMGAAQERLREIQIRHAASTENGTE